MQTLSGTVGEAGANARHDTALVQAILLLTARPANLDPKQPKYLQGTIDGGYGGVTKAAIQQFQFDNVFVDAGGNASQSVSGATAGLVTPGDATWTKMIAAVPAEFADLRVLTGSKIVYVAALPALRAMRVASANQMTFEARFRSMVVTLIDRVFERYGIAAGVCRDGDRRTFQRQYELFLRGPAITSAGPGESNHNFGQAADMGFEGLRWLRPDGTVVENETSWMHQLDPGQHGTRETAVFWSMLRTEGIQVGMFRGPINDNPHLQAWDDAGLDMASRLADLLTRSGRMRWTGTRQRYQCDFGLGGQFFDVGTAPQIWTRQSLVTADALTRARAQAAARPAAGAAPARPPAAGARPAAQAVTVQDVVAMQAALRADFEAADVNWQAWRSR
jgi:hypothetical protein